MSGPENTVFRIASESGLCADDQRRLLGVQPATLFKWSKAPPVALPRDTLERIGYVLGIYKALRILLPTPMSSRQWVHHPNSAPTFSGRPPLDRLRAGTVSDLFVVREYLDAQSI
jgi:hypothetical protein